MQRSQTEIRPHLREIELTKSMAARHETSHKAPEEHHQPTGADEHRSA
jgi:hypothetical protein